MPTDYKKHTYSNIHDSEELLGWLRDQKIDEIECLVPDINGIMRGKTVPRNEFVQSISGEGLRVPEAAIIQSVMGESEFYSNVAAEVDQDVYMVPDPTTVCIVPWCEYPTAQIICDTYNKHGAAISFAPRNLLKKVIADYAELGLQPVVAPEVEFYLTEKNIDPDLPLMVPIGVSGRREAGRQAYGIEAANEYDPVINLIYDYCEECGINIGTSAHEAGPAQMEINFKHGDPLSLADQVFLFKRIVRQAAQLHGMYATFMAQPHETEPGSAMHIHQSILDIKSGTNIFSSANGEDSEALLHYIGGLQVYARRATALFCPNVNSYRRMRLESDAPINLHWGRDNRTCGLRIPDSKAQARRVENRIGGADSNPYLAIAATLACGLLGMNEKREPQDIVTSDAHELEFSLPRDLMVALDLLDDCAPLRGVLGDQFINAFLEVKKLEFRKYSQVVSSWERKFLLLSV